MADSEVTPTPAAPVGEPELAALRAAASISS